MRWGLRTARSCYPGCRNAGSGFPGIPERRDRACSASRPGRGKSGNLPSVLGSGGWWLGVPGMAVLLWRVGMMNRVGLERFSVMCFYARVHERFTRLCVDAHGSVLGRGQSRFGGF